MIVPLVIIVLSFGLSAQVPARAQPEGHGGGAQVPALQHGAPPAASAHEGHEMPRPEGHEMMMTDALGLPFNRFGSGTAWMPDTTPMYAVMEVSDGWNLMVHGGAHLMYVSMAGARGEAAVDLPNWAHLMARHKTGPRDHLLLKGMVSLDPATIGGGGYPLLFQTGETWNGVALMDHQHPHNYLSELAGRYTHEFGADGASYAYVGIVGEPALGPPAFMHRTQALDNPLAPIGHHWQDATHIAYGVITLGYHTSRWQVEASTFNGREPGENRWEIQGPKLDSASARLSINPSPEWALQVSHGYLHSPEALHPGEDTWRTTASAVWNRRLNERENLQAVFVWGRNRIAGQDLDSFLLEGQWKRDGGWTPYVRYEHIEKNAEELVVPFPPLRVFNLQQLTLGMSRDIYVRGDYQWAVGVQALLNFVPGDLKAAYGDDPLGWVVYVRAHPRKMAH